MKRFLLVLVSILFLLTPLSSHTLDEIITSAKENSSSYQKTLLGYNKSLLSIQKSEEKEGPTFTVSGTIDPLNKSFSSLTKDSYALSLSPSLSVTLPDDGKTTLTLGGDYTMGYDFKDFKNSGSVNVGASHTFDFSPLSSNKKDLDLLKTKYSTENSFKKAELNFEKSVISAVSSLLSTEKSLKSSTASLEKQKKNLSTMETLGTYTTTSSIYINSVNSIKRAEDNLSSLERRYEKQKESFKTLTSLEWEGVEGLEIPELELKLYDYGNTDVYISSLDYESAKEDYNNTLSSLSPSKLSVSGNGSISLSKDSNTYLVSGSATYTTSNLSLSVNPSYSYNSGKDKHSPSVTISGKWNNGNNDSDYKTKVAENSLLSAEIDYNNKLLSYNEEAREYNNSLLSWEEERDSTLSQKEYLENVYNSKKELYDLGLISSDEYEDAARDLELYEYDYLSMILSGLSLKRDLDIFAL